MKNICCHYDMYEKLEAARDKENPATMNKRPGKIFYVLPVCHLVNNSFPNTNSTTINKS